MLKGRARRAVTSILVLFWIISYLAVAWYVGSSYVPETWLWQLFYFPIAGLLWVPGAVFIMHRMAEKTAPI